MEQHEITAGKARTNDVYRDSFQALEERAKAAEIRACAAEQALNAGKCGKCCRPSLLQRILGARCFCGEGSAFLCPGVITITIVSSLVIGAIVYALI